jgi:UDP-GlcNAc3NAcA epimerase
MIKILTIVGARPQFIKAAGLSRAINEGYSHLLEEIIVHTGQHYDPNMSDVFFDELGIPKPKYSLEISGGDHGDMTGRMLIAIEKVIKQEQPDMVLVYGDTNSTLAGALAAAKLHVPIAHVEAGLRSFNMKMPEEINRILADRVSSLLFCPTQTAIDNLQTEGVTEGVYNVGDIMYDVALFYKDAAKNNERVLKELEVETSEYVLATCHRAENTNDADRLHEIITGISKVANEIPVIFALHPRTKQYIKELGCDDLLNNVTLVDPLPFLEMVALEQSAKLILTDSGGVQKEAFFYGVPCLTMRDESEWLETINLGMNKLVGASKTKIVSSVKEILSKPKPDLTEEMPYGDGTTSKKILDLIIKFQENNLHHINAG